jgi:hypothetical protein
MIRQFIHGLSVQNAARCWKVGFEGAAVQHPEGRFKVGSGPKRSLRPLRASSHRPPNTDTRRTRGPRKSPLSSPTPQPKPPHSSPQIPPNTPEQASGATEYWESLSPCQSSFVHCCKSCGSLRRLKPPLLPPQLRVRRVLSSGALCWLTHGVERRGQLRTLLEPNHRACCPCDPLA